jgi:hypothetical protein
MSEVTQRLTAAGWHVTPWVFAGNVSTELLAQRPGESVVIDPFNETDGVAQELLISYDHRVPAVTWEGGGIGLAVGFALGWLLAAWLLRGVRDYGSVARGVLGITGLTAFGLELLMVFSMVGSLNAGLGGRLSGARVLSLAGSGLADSVLLLALLAGVLTVAATVVRTVPPRLAGAA